MKQKPALLIIILAIIPLITLSVTLQSINKEQKINSEAQIPTLNPPYIRMSSSNKAFGIGEEVPVQIFVNTNDIPSLESHLVISYDNSVLSLTPNDIENNNIYPVVNIESIDNGTAIFSVFVKNEAGYLPVILSEEKQVATINFHIINNTKKETPINLVLNKTDKSTSIITTDGSPEKASENILNSVYGTTIQIQ